MPKSDPFEKFELSISAIPVSQTVNQQKRTPLYMTVFSRIPRVNRKRCPKATPLWKIWVLDFHDSCESTSEPEKAQTPYIILGPDFLQFRTSTKSDAWKWHLFKEFELSISLIPASQPVNQQKRTPLLRSSRAGFSWNPQVNQKQYLRATTLCKFWSLNVWKIWAHTSTVDIFIVVTMKAVTFLTAMSSSRSDIVTQCVCPYPFLRSISSSRNHSCKKKLWKVSNSTCSLLLLLAP